MNKSNHFSRRFTSKSTEELRLIKDSKEYSEGARFAALWELEKRGDNSVEDVTQAKKIEKKQIYIESRGRNAQKYRTFWPRFVAAIIDGLLLGFVVFMLGFVGLTSREVSYEFSLTYELAMNLLVYIYYVVMHGLYGQTVGKMAMSVKVVNYPDEEDIDMTQALKRDIVPIIFLLLGAVFNFIIWNSTIDLSHLSFIIFLASTIPAIWGVLEIITMLTNSKSRALHDFIAGTVVIRTD